MLEFLTRLRSSAFITWVAYFALFSAPLSASEAAVDVFERFQKAVFQIKILEQGSESQSSLGTGFAISEYVLATNYHVIASAIFEPSKYRIEIKRGEQTVLMDIVAIDVVNDLAILAQKSGDDSPPKPFELVFELAKNAVSQGETLYSLGNPHNLGLTVVEGNFNGFVEHRFNEQIHFSGAVNPGMSGGPVVGRDAAVVGINVATSGNQIGFLVPVAKLLALRESLGESLTPLSSDALKALIAQQVGEYTQAMVDAALADSWTEKTIGDATVASSGKNWLDCWGDSDDDKEQGTLTVNQGCHSGAVTFLNVGFNTGFIEYEYMWFEAPAWPSLSVYRKLAFETARAMPSNRGRDTDLTSFDCKNAEVVNGQGFEARTSYCVRAYKELPELFDVFFMAVSTDRPNAGLMTHFTLAGVNRAVVERFLAHFIEVPSWQ